MLLLRVRLSKTWPMNQNRKAPATPRHQGAEAHISKRSSTMPVRHRRAIGALRCLLCSDCGDLHPVAGSGAGLFAILGADPVPPPVPPQARRRRSRRRAGRQCQTEKLENQIAPPPASPTANSGRRSFTTSPLAAAPVRDTANRAARAWPAAWGLRASAPRTRRIWRARSHSPREHDSHGAAGMPSPYPGITPCGHGVFEVSIGYLNFSTASDERQKHKVGGDRRLSAFIGGSFTPSLHGLPSPNGHSPVVSHLNTKTTFRQCPLLRPPTHSGAFSPPPLWRRRLSGTRRTAARAWPAACAPRALALRMRDVRRLAFRDAKPDLPSRWNGRRHQLPDGVEHAAKLCVVPGLQFVQLACQIGMRGQHRPQLPESSHDRNINLDSPRTVQHARQHGDTVLGEGHGKITLSTPRT